MASFSPPLEGLGEVSTILNKRLPNPFKVRVRGGSKPNTMLQKLLFFLVFISCSAAEAQSWQWGVRGGGALSTSSRDVIIDMCTDKLGNIYSIAEVATNGIETCYIGDTSLDTYGGNLDIVLFSYNCNNQFRWAKMIGSSFTPDRATAIAIDSLNNIYVSGYSIGQNFNVGNDTTTSSTNTKGMFIASFDTSGTFNWFRQVTPDTVNIINQKYYQFYDIVGAQNGIYGLAKLKSGLLSNSSIVITTPGIYMLYYTAQGVLTSATPMDMQVNPDATSFSNIRLVRMPSGKFIISGILTATPPSVNYNFSVGGNTVDHPIFVCCFSNNGSFLWLKKGQDVSSTNSNSYLSGFHYRPFFDKVKNHILLAGRSYPQLSFLGYTFNNQLGAASIPFACSLDTLGSLIWITNASSNGTSTAKGISSTIQGVYVTGDYPGTLQWGSKLLINEANRGYDIFLATLDANTGNTIALDSLDSDFGYNDAASTIVSDNKGNVYIGGSMGNKLYVGNADTLQSSGGSSDFFIAKFGTANCSNSVVPITLKAFTANLKQQQVQCSWQSEQEVNSSHYIVQRSVNEINYSNIATLPTKGSGNQYSYTDYLSKELQQVTKTLYYRLAMVDKDGAVQYSRVAAVNLTQQQHIQVYPNPVKDQLTLVLAQTSSSKQLVQLFSLQGKQLLQNYVPVNSSVLQIPVKTISKGSYILKVGAYSTLIVKE
jgi:hypothetical protein